MKTSELKRRLEALGYEVEEDPANRKLIVYRIRAGKVNQATASIPVDEPYLDYVNFGVQPVFNKLALWDLLTAYVATPLEERKDEVRFRVKHNTDIYFPYFGQSDLYEMDYCDEEHAAIFTPTTWDKARGNMPPYKEGNPLFEVVSGDD